MEKNLDQLRFTSDNPRLLMQDNAEKLDRSIDKFGPVDGIVMNVNPAINELVSGNQRTAKFKAAGLPIIITHKFDDPTSVGTVAYGYVDADGERWPYREVHWDKSLHDQGVVLANQHAGAEDVDLLAERYETILAEDPEALDALFITTEEIATLQDGWVDHESLASAEGDKAADGGADAKGPYTLKQLRALRDSFSEGTGRGDNGFVEWLAEREG